MNSLFNELEKTSLSVFDVNKDEILGHAFVLTFKNPEKGIMPFLITTRSVVEKAEYGFVSFGVSMNGIKEKFYVSFKKADAINSLLDGTNICAFPIANVYDAIAKSKKDFEFKSISHDMVLDEKNETKVSDIESVHYFAFSNELNKNVYISRNAITPINDDDGFYVEKSVESKSGSPVFINNSGTYVENNSIVLGSRLILVGIIDEISKNYSRVFPIKHIVESIRTKYNITF